MRLRNILVFLILSIFTIPSFAWTKLGHMVIASIAYEYLKPSVQQKVNTLVTTLKQEYPQVDSFLLLSYWPNELREEEVNEFTRWHYIDQSWSGDGTPIINLITTDNAIWAIDISAPVVSNPEINTIERARYLGFLVHIVADVHQPLHVSTRFSKAHRNGDAGGTEYDINYQGISIPIHYFWDTGVTFFNSIENQQNATLIAKHVMQDYPPNYFATQIRDLDPANWAKEGLSIAKSFVYAVPEHSAPTPSYIAAGRKISEERVALAGYRLAALLNQLLV